VSLPSVADLLRAGRPRQRPEVLGRVTTVTGLAVTAVGVDAAVGEICDIRTAAGTVLAELVGFADEAGLLMPIGDTAGIAPGDAVIAHGHALQVIAGDACLGRVLDGLGRPLDGGPDLVGTPVPIRNDAPAPLARLPIQQAMETGVSAIDGFLTCGHGQRIGIFAGSGVGKSTLLGMIARGSSADINVIALVGERGREVKDFIEDVLRASGMAKSVVVVATSDQPPLLRFKATFTAIALAEHFRDQGRQVLFMMDSVTRFAAAAREIGLAAGEPPTLRGYPPSLFAQLPRVVERLGTARRGSITGLLTVLVEGDDLNEPVSDTMRGLLDGHIVLDRAIAARGHFPAIQVLASVSRLMPRVTSPDHQELARRLRGLLAIYEESRELIQVGAYQGGSDPRLDEAIRAMPALERLLFHGQERRDAAATRRLMVECRRGVPG
jgi:flagellum-specific ATP synthase/type III secretion protein N (ATPase)